MSDETQEFTGQKPRVNEAREFIEIAKDFKRPQELLREALSNSWDASASTVSISIDATSAQRNTKGRKKQLLNITIQDDGDGMNSEEIGFFFNLGDSHKPAGSIGTKGHGTKIYYKSEGIGILTHKDGNTITAETEVAPWESLKRGIIPTYRFKISPNTAGARGTTIRVFGFDATHSEFESLNEVTQYVRWSTIGGSLQRAMVGHARKMTINLKLPGMAGKVTLANDFELPDERPEITKGTSSIVKAFPTVSLSCGQTSEGVDVKVDVHVIVLGDEARSFIPVYVLSELLKVPDATELSE
jgi:Histidine kinase-, DNA gyrase B-, and HSP90-like ATPase